MKSFILLFGIVFASGAVAEDFDLFCFEEGSKNFAALFTTPELGHVLFMDGEYHCQPEDARYDFPKSYQMATLGKKVVTDADGKKGIVDVCKPLEGTGFDLELGKDSDDAYVEIKLKGRVFKNCVSEEEFFSEHPSGEID